LTIYARAVDVKAFLDFYRTTLC